MRTWLSMLSLSATITLSASAGQISTVTPAYGSVLGGTEVSIRAGKFALGPDLKVLMPAPATVISADQYYIRIVTPPHALPEKVDITVIDQDGISTVAPAAFEYFAGPTITGISPNVGPLSGGNTVRINGSHFFRLGAVEVRFGDTPATIVSVTTGSPGGLSCIVPPGNAGPVTVTVTNVGSGSTTADFTYQDLTLTSVSPPQGPAVSNTDVYIAGTGFASSPKVFLGNLEATVLDTTPTQIHLVSPYTTRLGAVDVTVTNADGTSATLPFGYAFRQSRPRLDISTKIPSSGKEWMPINGTELDIHNPTVLFGRTPALAYNYSCGYLQEAQFCCLVPPGVPGPVDITVIGADGGKFTLTDTVSYFQSPGNDDCANAYALSFDAPMYYSINRANPESTACPFGDVAPSVWYRFTPPQDGFLDVFAASDQYLTIDLMGDCCGEPLAPRTGCVSPTSCLSNVPLSACTEYLIRVLGDASLLHSAPDPHTIYAAFRPVPGAVPCAAEGEGEGEGATEGAGEGEGEGSAEGEGEGEGEGTSTPTENTVDTDHDGRISLSELLRLIQFYRLGIGCSADTEDGFDPGSADHTCAHYSADYNPTDWQISLSEALRAIQLYSAGAYHPCPEGEDGFCPGP